MNEQVKPGLDVKKLQDLTEKKLELVVKLRELRAQIGHLNVELARAGADSAVLACW